MLLIITIIIYIIFIILNTEIAITIITGIFPPPLDDNENPFNLYYTSNLFNIINRNDKNDVIYNNEIFNVFRKYRNYNNYKSVSFFKPK